MEKGLATPIWVQTMTRTRIVAVGAFALYVGAVAYNVLTVLLRMEPPHWILAANALTFFVFAIAHASDRLGTRAMLVFLGITFVVNISIDQRAIALITFFSMGAFLFVALTRWMRERIGVNPETRL